VGLGSSNVIKISSQSDSDPEFVNVVSSFRVNSGCVGMRFFQFNSTTAQSFQLPSDDDGYYSGDDDSDDMSGYYYGYDMDLLYAGALNDADDVEVVEITEGVNGGGFVDVVDYYYRVIVVSTHGINEYDEGYNCTLQYR